MSTKMIHGASSSSPWWTYDVFLSFCGKDTHKNFTSHLFRALVQDGIHTFKDDEELERGEDISSELMDAIEGSRIAIIVFSENYASSSWCLDELVQILKCQKNGQTVLPVFYKVDPSDVRHRKKTFAKAFVKHEKRPEKEMGKVESWKNALTEAANLSGWDHMNVANGNESELIKKIVEEVSRILKQTHLHVAEYPVGLDSHIERITCLLNDGLDVVRFLGIYGLGGIGKTTIAKDIFNAMFQNFEGSSFLANVREASSQHRGLVNLQKQLLSDVLKKRNDDQKNEDMSNEDKGIIIIKERLRRKRVLIVLDDVDAKKQLDNLVGKHDWFGMGSRIIITTRNEHLLNIAEVDKKYKVETMNENESLQLFSLHAFRQSHPLEGYFQLSSDIVRYAGGLPLALVILGSLLLDKRSYVEWESELEKLRKIPNNQIFEILEVSYHALDDSNQTIFLDISCFFIGKKKDATIEILDACGLYPKVGIRLLIQRSLLTIDEFGQLQMHDLVRDMGREIVRRQSPQKPGERSRLWQHDETLDVLRNLTGTNAVDRLMFDTYGFFAYGSRREDRFQLTTDAFFKMPDLRVLCIENGFFGTLGVIKSVHCPEDEKILFKNLICLRWNGVPLKYIPNNFHLGNLVILDMSSSSDLKQLWKGTKHLPKLKVLNLSGCSNLTCIPDFSGFPNLEKLILIKYNALAEVHESIGHLSNLVELNLCCAKISSLPSSISKLASLEKLDISKCGRLENLPEGIGNLTRLSVLKVSGCISLESLPNLSNLKHLRILDLSRCQKLNVIEGFEGLESAESIKLYGCGNLTSFTKEKIFQLKVLDLSWCFSLTYMPDFSWFPNLEKLILPDCCSLVEVHESIGHLSNLVQLNLTRCTKISSLPSSISKLASLEELNISGCERLENLPEGIGNLTRLSVLDVSRCTLLESLPNLSNLKHLRILDLSSCQKLNVIKGFEVLESAETINLQWCENLTSFGEERIFQHLPKLKVLDLSFCCNLTCIPDFSGFPNLEKLILHWCLTLVEVHESIGHLSNLVQLNLCCCTKISSLPSSISKLASLEDLDISGCERLENLPEGIGNLTRLSMLDVSGCTLLESLPNLSNLKHLRFLNLSHCKKLSVIEGFEGLESAKTIKLYGCGNLTSFTKEKIFQVIFEDFCNRNICSICLPHPINILERFDIPSETVPPASYCVVTQLPNMEIQGVIICVVFELCEKFSNSTPVVVVHNQSKNVTQDRSGDWYFRIEKVVTSRIWMIKIPQCVWKSIAECGDIIKISAQSEIDCSIRLGANFYTLQGKVIHARVCDMIKDKV